MGVAVWLCVNELGLGLYKQVYLEIGLFTKILGRDNKTQT